MQKNTEIHSVQLLRAVASIAVAAFHTHLILSQPEYGSVDVFNWLVSKGWMGVNLFFVLSGFIIFFAHKRDIGHPEELRRYFWRRFSRIYPVYWLLLTMFILAALRGIGHADIKWEFPHFLTAYTLLQFVDMPFLPLKVAWTLLFEVKFYLLFALLLVSRRWGMTVMIVWGIAVLIRNCFHPLPDWGYVLPDWGLLNIWNIYFMTGMLAALAYSRLPDRMALVALGFGLALLLVVSPYVDDMGETVRTPALMIVLSVSFSSILLGVVASERRYNFYIPRFALLLGDASYSIYLIHSAVISLVAGLNYRLTFHLIPEPVIFVIAFITAVAAGVMFHLIAERPILRWARHMLPSRPVYTRSTT